MAGRLKIYACSGFEAAKDFKYLLTEEKSTVDNTQVVNMMLSNINLARTEIAYLQLTNQEIYSRLNYIDLCALIENIAERYTDNREELQEAGMVITYMLNKGLFECTSTDENDRAEHLDKLFSVFDELMQSGDVDVSERDTKWWQDEVMQYCKVGLTQDQRKKVKSVLDKQKIAVGSTINVEKDLAEHINNAGSYFMYTFLTEAQLKKLPAKFQAKKKRQVSVYNYDLQLFQSVYGKGKQAFDQEIRASIIKDWGCIPEEACQHIIDGRNEKHSVDGAIMWTAATVVKLIAVLVPIIVALIYGICKCVSDIVIAKNQSLSKEYVESAAFGTDDVDDSGSGKTLLSGLGNNTLLLAVGAALLYSAFVNND